MVATCNEQAIPSPIEPSQLWVWRRSLVASSTANWTRVLIQSHTSVLNGVYAFPKNNEWRFLLPLVHHWHHVKKNHWHHVAASVVSASGNRQWLVATRVVGTRYNICHKKQFSTAALKSFHNGDQKTYKSGYHWNCVCHFYKLTWIVELGLCCINRRCAVVVLKNSDPSYQQYWMDCPISSKALPTTNNGLSFWFGWRFGVAISCVSTWFWESGNLLKVSISLPFWWMQDFWKSC